MLVLADHIFCTTSSVGTPCAAQMLQARDSTGSNIIGLQVSSSDTVSNFGAVSGKLWREGPDDDGAGMSSTLLELDAIMEKPTAAQAKEKLSGADGLQDDEFWTLFGFYILSSSIFDIISEGKHFT